MATSEKPTSAITMGTIPTISAISKALGPKPKSLGALSALSILVLLLLVPNAHALALAPSSISLEYKPGLRGTFYYMVKNHRTHPMYLDVNVTGDLEEYISITPQKVWINGDNIAFLRAKLDLPYSMQKGKYHTYTVVSETSETFKNQNGAVALAEVVGEIQINVPKTTSRRWFNLITGWGVGGESTYETTSDGLGWRYHLANGLNYHFYRITNGIQELQHKGEVYDTSELPQAQ